MKRTADSKAELFKEALPALEEILSVFRHQLGNAVNALKVTLDVLEQNFDFFDEQKKREYLKRASGILERQQAMVEAMKSYAHTNANEHRPIDFLPFWEHWLEGAKKRIEAEGAALTHRVEASARIVSGDPLALRTVLDEILGNALEATEGRKDRRIHLTAERKGDEFHITISDTGCGINEGELTKVCVPLFTTKPGRKGMGLPIALKLLSQMGGRMEIEPLPEPGTRVRMRLHAGGDDHEKAL